jgi:putative flippase GtrA
VDRLRANRELLREIILFVIIGVGNTALFFIVYNVLRFVLPPFHSNAIAVVFGAMTSFWANRRFTFRVKGSERVARQLLEFAAVFAVTLVLSTGALEVLYRMQDHPSRLAENVALGVGSVATVSARFALLRFWVFRSHRATRPAGVEQAHVRI